MTHLSKPPVVKTASALVHDGPCIFHGFLIGTDGVNDPTITFYNNTAATGQKIIPTNQYDAALLGINGVTGINQYCDKGLYLDISIGAGTVEVVTQVTSL